MPRHWKNDNIDSVVCLILMMQSIAFNYILLWLLHATAACPRGTYLSPSNGSCSTCPANSVSEKEALTQCTCLEGYYRAPQGEEDLPCHCMLL